VELLPRFIVVLRTDCLKPEEYAVRGPAGMH